MLKELSRSDFLIIGDWRHYFHQFALHDDVSSYFGLEQGEDTYVYRVLPMGWSWSPRIAQSLSMAILLEAGSRAGLLDPADYADSPNPPSIIRMRGGCATVWYDNVLCMFTDAAARDKYYTKLEELCSVNQLNVVWKDLRKWNRKDMPETCETLPTYLGLMLANAASTRHRSDDGTARIKWKHDPARLARWLPMTTREGYTTLRSIARAVGCILWDAVISLRQLCYEGQALKILSKAGKAVKNQNWDAPLEPSEISPEEVEYLRMRMDMIVKQNDFHSVKTVLGAEVINCASDACGAAKSTKTTRSKQAGYGYVIWSGDTVDVTASRLQQQFFPDALADAHIYILEMYAALKCIEQVSSTHRGCLIRLAEDNTAVVGSLRNGYSHNAAGNELIQRIYAALESSGCRLEIVPVPSAANAADAPSRGLPYCMTADKKCKEAFEAHVQGMGRSSRVAVRKFSSVGDSLRHEEPDDNVWTMSKMNFDSLFDNQSDISCATTID